QDQLAKSPGDPQAEIKSALNDILANTREIAHQLKGNDLEDLDEETLGRTALGIAEALYLKAVADSYLYADFKGIEQLEKFISLKLDEVFVNLKVTAESASAERREREDDLRRSLLKADAAERGHFEEQLTALDVGKVGAKGSTEALTIDRVLGKLGSAV